MAAANLTTHIPITQVQNKANTTPFTYALPEKAGQTFRFGVPLMLSTTSPGYTMEWDGTSFTNAIVGVSESNGQNLGSDGLGAPSLPWGGIVGTGALQVYPPPPPNQPNAVNIALGAPVSDGRSLFISPGVDNVYEAIFDNANGASAADYTPAQADIGKSYGLTRDSGTYATWYVDKNKTGGNVCLQIVGVNPADGFIVNARVRFVFLPGQVVSTF